MSYDIRGLSSLKRHWLQRSSNIPPRFLGIGPEDLIAQNEGFPIEIEEWLESAIEGKIIKNIGGLGLTGTGLLFDGSPGLGKTTHAVVSMMEFVRRLPNDDAEAAKILGMNLATFGMNSRPVYYLTYPEFLSRKKALMSADSDEKRRMQDEIEGLHGRSTDDQLNVRVLILDDLGKEYGSKYDDTSFDEILRSRYDKALPTIITTNVNRDDWSKQYGEAMGSFAFEAFTRVRIIGKDLRKK